MINENELDRWILDELSNGPRTSDHLMQGCIDVIKAVVDVAVREAVGRLRMGGRIKLNPDGTWKLRTRPIVVAEVPGNPNFRRGGM